MSILHDNIDSYITDLLHINNCTKNRLIDLFASDSSKVYLLTHSGFESVGAYVLGIISSRIGKPGNTAMLHSSVDPSKEQRLGSDINTVDWVDGNGIKDPKALHKYIENVYKELSLKGNNPLFLSVGAVNWDVEIKKDEIKSVKTPFLIFPIRLIRTDSANSPVYIEFIKDDIYVNPCFLAKLRQIMSDRAERLISAIPLPKKCKNIDEPIDSEAFSSDASEYLESVESFVNEQGDSGSSVFRFEKNTVAIAQYNHDELCMYYDIKRNKNKLLNSKLAERIFTYHDEFLPSKTGNQLPQCVLQSDSVQDKIICRVVNGESLIIKGPPGTGKTLTITNMISSLLAEGKKVILTSQKPAAMTEVVAKLPEALRKFVLLLDCETEEQAARLNPVDIRHELSSLISDVKKFAPDNKVHDDIMSGMNEKKISMGVLDDYRKLMFESDVVIGHSIYEALDILCKKDIVPIMFTESSKAISLKRAEYNELASSVRKAASYFEQLSKEHSIQKCPWIPSFYAYDKDILTSALERYTAASDITRTLLSRIAALPCVSQNKNTLVAELEALVTTKVRVSQVKSVILASERVSRIRSAYIDFVNKYSEENGTVKLRAPSNKDYSRILSSLGDLDKDLLIADFVDIESLWSVTEALADPAKLSLFMKLIEKLKNTSEEIDKLEERFYSVFDRSALNNGNTEIIDDACVAFAVYEDSCVKPSLFDFKTKKLYKSIQNYGYGKPIPFNDAVKAVKCYDTIKRLNNQLNTEKASFAAKFKHEFCDEQFTLISILLQRSVALEINLKDYIEKLSKHKDKIRALIDVVEYNDNATLEDLITVISNYCNLKALKEVIEDNGDGLEFGIDDDSSVLDTAKAVTAILYLKNSGIEDADKIYETASTIYQSGKDMSADIQKLKVLLSDFALDYFKSYYSSLFKLTVEDLGIFAAEATDKSILFAASEYVNIIYNSGRVELDRFFRPFENGLRSLDGDTFEEHFEHSVFHLAVQAVFKALGDKLFGIGNKITHTLLDFQNADQKTRKAMLSLIEQRCISRISPDDPDFAFLSTERASGETLRRLFKNKAAEIMKLKKCFILSPSAISVFFGTSEFSDFDVVIVDEASQLSPTAILPALFRTKQVVLVGDEWQMPPIKHFSSKNEHKVIDENGEAIYMSPDTSVLGLALSNCAFPVEKLVCHYRSRTESLITYSQKRFYDYMRTFPTAVPKTDTIGLRDIYVPSGYCDDAVNEAEAKQAVIELKNHFERFYRDGVLAESVGIVAFGEKQLNRIKALIFDDKELSRKIDKALSSFDDLDEKLIFFKTILTVQGQETDHLIISLTYGKNKNGNVVQSFGELNLGQGAGKLGECIFNVAVTRAKSSLTMIHSVRSSDITNENVAFIADYLKTVERFDKSGDTQFVGERIDNVRAGFVRQVAEFISECGVARDRIIIDFGATVGSVRIPIVILSEDKASALLGIWCEGRMDVKQDYLDYNLRYYSVLEQRGWLLHRLFIADWVDNKENAKNELRQKIKNTI